MASLINKIKSWLGGSSQIEDIESSPAPAPQHSDTGSSPFKVDHVQQTPNPDAAQFIMNRPVIESGTKSITSAEDAKGDPLSEALFQVFGVENVFIKENFITVNKSPIRGWNQLIDEITLVLNSNLHFYEKADGPVEVEGLQLDSSIKEFTPDTFLLMQDDQKRLIIDALFEHSIRPALAYDGGGLTLQGVKGNVVEIEYQGSCGTCPSSRAGTLQYIETMLKENLHPDLQVEAL